MGDLQIKPLRPALFMIFALILTHIPGGVTAATTISFINNCEYPVWPGIQPMAGKPILARGGFELLPGKSHSLPLPANWSGRVWGRHDCNFNKLGQGNCATGDCGAGLYCNGLGGAPPATVAEITLGAEMDFYDVSLLDGYNLAVSITPFNGAGGNCVPAGCVSDLNHLCPAALQVKAGDSKVVACRSACAAFSSPRYCCTGSFGSPQTCKPTMYSRIFKVACPRAYSYTYDDPTSISTCTRADYLITFCPHRLEYPQVHHRRLARLQGPPAPRAAVPVREEYGG